jgi:hypothetical protein
LRLIAKRQRWLLWLVLAAVVTNLLGMASNRSASLILGVAVLAIALTLTVVILIGVIQLLVAMRTNVVLIILCALLTVAPCINLLVLLVVNMVATSVLRGAGLKVKFMGVPDEDVVRHLNPNLCKVCGYDLTGNVSGRCSECGTPTPRGVPIAIPLSPAPGGGNPITGGR